MRFDYCSHDVVSFFQKQTYRVKILIDVTSNFLLTMESLLDTCDGPTLSNEDLLSPAWKESIELTQSPKFRAVNCEALNVGAVVPLLICTSDLCVRVQFRLSRISPLT